MPPPPPPRPEAVTPPPQQEGGRIASAREGASSALASASSGARGAKTVVAGHLNPTKEQKKGSAGVAFLRQKDLSKPTLMVPSKQYRVQLKGVRAEYRAEALVEVGLSLRSLAELFQILCWKVSSLGISGVLLLML